MVLQLLTTSTETSVNASSGVRSKGQYWVRALAILTCVFFLTGCEGLYQSAGQALLRIEGTYAYVMDFLISFAYLSGALFVVKGIFAFKIYGEQRTMMSSQMSIRIPMAYFAAGICLLFLPKLISIMSNTVFMQPSIDIMSYQANQDSWQNVKIAVEGLVQVVGLVSILRAFFLASVPHYPTGGGQGTLGKAVVHFFAGLAALNIDYLVRIVDYYL